MRQALMERVIEPYKAVSHELLALLLGKNRVFDICWHGGVSMPGGSRCIIAGDQPVAIRRTSRDSVRDMRLMYQKRDLKALQSAALGDKNGRTRGSKRT